MSINDVIRLINTLVEQSIGIQVYNKTNTYKLLLVSCFHIYVNISVRVIFRFLPSLLQQN